MIIDVAISLYLLHSSTELFRHCLFAYNLVVSLLSSQFSSTISDNSLRLSYHSFLNLLGGFVILCISSLTLTSDYNTNLRALALSHREGWAVTDIARFSGGALHATSTVTGIRQRRGCNTRAAA